MEQNCQQDKTLKWMPSLYFAKGLLFVVLFSVTLIMLRQTGQTNATATLCVALCYFPWVTKCWWKSRINWANHCWRIILLTELILVVAFSLLAYVLSEMWQTTCLLMLIAIITSIHNVAVDTYYNYAVESSPKNFRTIRELARKLADVVGVGMLVMLVGNLQIVYRNAWLYSWRTALYCVASVFLLLFFWHLIVLPRKSWHQKRKSESMGRLSSKSVVVLLTFFLAPAILCKMTALFLIENQSGGGLGLSPQELGLVLGTVGVIGLTIGLVAGHRLTDRYGVHRILLPMSFVLFIPSATYVLFSYWQPESLLLVCVGVLIEQTAFGLGLSTYLCYQSVMPDRESAKSTMALVMMLGCAVSGALQTQLGYNAFFLTTLSLSIVAVFSSRMVGKY